MSRTDHSNSSACTQYQHSLPPLDCLASIRTSNLLLPSPIVNGDACSIASMLAALNRIEELNDIKGGWATAKLPRTIDQEEIYIQWSILHSHYSNMQIQEFTKILSGHQHHLPGRPDTSVTRKENGSEWVLKP